MILSSGFPGIRMTYTRDYSFVSLSRDPLMGVASKQNNSNTVRYCFCFQAYSSLGQARLAIPENKKPFAFANGFYFALAEKEGFEPPVRRGAQRFSRPPHSTTLPFLRRKDSIFFILQNQQ